MKTKWEDCDVYCDGKYLGKADIEFDLTTENCADLIQTTVGSPPPKK